MKKDANMLIEKNRGLARATAKGFTILEIIVVIAIIGILATVLVSNLSSVALKARDAVTKIEMDTLVKAGTKYFDEKGGWYTDEDVNFCFDSESQAIYNRMDNKTNEAYCHVAEANTAWAICAKLNIGNSQAWCVDNTGAKSEISMDNCSQNILSCSNPTFVSAGEVGGGIIIGGGGIPNPGGGGIIPH